MDKVTVWTSIQDGGDGSANNLWFLTEEDAEYDQENMHKEGYGWAEPCVESVETFVGSDIHIKAVENSKELKENNE